MFDVICIGSATTDIFLETGLKEVNRKIAYPVGDKIPLTKIDFEVGGGGVNVSAGLSKMGLKTAYLGKIGNDESGRRILRKLKKEKVKFIGKISNGNSGYGIVLDSFEKNRTILTYHGLTDNLKEKDIKYSSIKSKWIFFSTLREDSLRTEIKILEHCQAKGIKTAFNMDARPLKKQDIDVKKILKKIDFLILNKEEAQLIVNGDSKKELAQKLYDLGPKTVVITDGDQEVISFDGAFNSIMPHKIKAKEKTGAGDAFTSGFLASLIKTQNIEKSLKMGLANSESVIQHFGSQKKLLTWKEAIKKI
ncbi:MAG: carbohydrate kinase family protein [Nanoarchaeota archaeon]